jgi:hypothetical protein
VSDKYAFIAAEYACFQVDGSDAPPLAQMLEWLDVSKSGFYEWRDRKPSATAIRREQLKEKIRELFTEYGGTYGYRRIHAELLRRGVQVGDELVRDLMRELDLVTVQPRPYRTTTVRGENEPDVPDLVRRDFTADRPGTKLVGDITYYVELLIMSTSVRSVLVSGVCRANLVGIIPTALGWFPRGAGGRALMDRTPGSGEIIPQSSPPTHIYQGTDRPSRNTWPNRAAESRRVPGP